MIFEPPELLPIDQQLKMNSTENKHVYAFKTASKCSVSPRSLMKDRGKISQITTTSTVIILGREERSLELFVGWLLVSIGAKDGFFRRECTLAGPDQRIRVNL